MTDSLVYIGKIVALNTIEGADFIVSSTVVCGKGGKWQGIVKKGQFYEGDLCVVFLPDALIPESEEMQFMKATNWRVKMRRFKGAPSEVVIMPIPEDLVGGNVIGDDVTTFFGVTKYQKPVPPNLQGRVLGDFPWFIPKTDEPNYQSCPELVDKLFGKPYYITEKVDGSSCTAYKYNGKFGLCSRNWELAREETNGYWKVALKYDLENNLPEGIAVQFEICGPKVQKNPMGLSELDGFVFSGFNINEKRYMRIDEIGDLCIYLKMNMVKVIDAGINFFPTGIESLGEGTYANGNQREGVVVRSQENFDGKPISFKVINLNYET